MKNIINTNHRIVGATRGSPAGGSRPAPTKWICLLFVFVSIATYHALRTTNQIYAAAGINESITLQGKVVNSDGTNVTDGAYDFVFKVYNGAGSSATSLFTESWTNTTLFTSTMSTAPSANGESLVYTSNTNESSLKVGQVLWNTTKQEPVTITAVDTATNTITISPTLSAWATSDTITNRPYVKDGIFRVAINSLNQNWGSIDFGDDSIFVGVNFNNDGEMKPRIRFSSVPYAMTAKNASTLGGIDTSGYLRSNTDDTFEAGHTLTVAGDINMTGNVSIADTDIALTGASTNLATTGNFTINTNQLTLNKTTGQLTVNGDIVSNANISGTWTGNAIGSQYGGTGANNSTAAQYSIPYYSNTGVLGGALAPGNTGYILVTNSTTGAPQWVDPSVVTGGTNYFQLNAQQISPKNALWNDILVGGDTTASAKIALQANTGYGLFSSRIGIGTLTPTALLDIASLSTSTVASLKVGGYIDLPTAMQLSTTITNNDLLLYLPFNNSATSSRNHYPYYTRSDTSSAATATQTTEGGWIQSDLLANNRPRIEKTNVGHGILMENTRKNELVRSSWEDGTTGWTNSGLETNTYSANYRKHLTYAANLADTNSTGGQLYQSLTLTNGQSYPFYCYAMNAGATSTFGSTVSSSDVQLYAGGDIATTYTAQGDGWYKLEGTVTGTGTAINYGVDVKANKAINLDACQIEADTTDNGVPYSTSYIYTNGSARTRGTTEETLDYYAFRGPWNQQGQRTIDPAKGTVSMWFKPSWSGVQPATDLYFMELPNVLRLYYSYSDDKIYGQVYNGTDWTTVSTSIDASTIAANSNNYVAFKWDSTAGATLMLNGATNSTSTTWTAQNSTVTYSTLLYFGSKSTAGGRIDADLSDIGVFGRQLTNAEIWQIYNNKGPIGDQQRNDTLMLQQNTPVYQRGSLYISGGASMDSLNTSTISSAYFGELNAANYSSHILMHLPFENTIDGSRQEVGTFTRADATSNAATQFDESTHMMSNKSANQPRFDSGVYATDPNTDTSNLNAQNGVYIEDSRTNIALDSSFETLSPWTAGTNCTGAQSTNYPLHGTYSLNLTSSAACRYTQTVDLSSVTAGTRHQVSAYVRRNESAAYGSTIDNTIASLYARTDDGLTALSTTYTSLGNGWYRLTGYFDSTAANNWDVGIYLPSTSRNIYVDGFQVERSGSNASVYGPSSFIPTTTTAVTRAAETLTYPLPTSFKSDKGSVSLWFKPNWTRAITGDTTDKYLFYIPNAYRLRLDGTNDRFSFDTYNGTNWTTVSLNTSTTDVTQYAWNHLTCSWYYSYTRCQINGVAYTASTAWTPQTPSPATIYVGSDNTGANQANAQISGFTLFDTALNSTQMTQLYQDRSKMFDYYRTDSARLSASGSTSFQTGNMMLNGTFAGSAGSATAPTYSFTSDQNTGIYLSASDTLNFATGGTSRMSIDSSGNVGVGTAPSYKLDIAGDVNTTGTYRMNGTDYGQYFIDSAGSNGYVWTSDGSGRGGWQDPVTLAGGTNYWQLSPGGEQLSAKNALWHDILVGGTTTASAKIALQANTGNAYIAGNVGIGTQSPAAKLDVVGGDIIVDNKKGYSTRTNTNAIAQLLYTDEWNNSYIGDWRLSSTYFMGPLGNVASIDNLGHFGIGLSLPTTGFFNVGGAATGKALAIFNETGDQALLTASASGVTKFIIDHSGNVGIGNAAPSYKLDVAGDINTTGTYRLNGSDVSQYFITSAGTNGQVWASDGSGAGTWTNMSSLINNNDLWQYNGTNGIAPGNLSYDVLLGGTTTASAKISLTSTGSASFAENVAIGATNATARLSVQGLNTTATTGSELLTTTADRDFSSNSGNWTGTGWTIGSGVATHTAGTANDFVHTFTPTAGATYQIKATVVTTVAGGIQPSIGGTTGQAVGNMVAGTLTQETWTITAANTASFRFTVGSSWAGTIDDISVMQVTPSSVIMALNNSGGNPGIEFRASGSTAYNMFMGVNAGNNTSTGTSNIGIGRLSLNNNTAGGSNVALGNATLYYNSVGGNNTAIGQAAMFHNQGGSYNTSLGAAAGYYLTDINSSYNTFVGAGSGQYLVSAANNVGLGYKTMYNAMTGSNNIAIGYQAADALDGGSNNIAIGYDIDLPTTTTSNMLDIGNLIYATGLTSTGTTVSTGLVGIGTTAPSAKLTVQGANSVASLGSELLTTTADRDFSSDSGNWTGTGWTIGSGVATHTAGANNYVHTFTPTAGATYQILATIVTTTGGTIHPEIGGYTLASNVGQSTGTLTQHAWVITATNTTSFRFVPSAAWAGTIDDVSVMRLTPSNVTAALLNSDGSTGLELRSGGITRSSTFVGVGAGQNNVSGDHNTAIGSGTLIGNTTGYYNIAIGASVMSSNTTGYYNTAVGGLNANTTGARNVSLGMAALSTNAVGNYNSAVGYNALGASTGSSNTALGYRAGDALVTGSTNIIIGYDIDLPSTSTSNTLDIGNLLYGAGLTSTGTTISSGRIGIGVAAPASRLDVQGGYAGNAAFNVNQTNTGDIITASSSGTTRMVLTSAGNLGLGVVIPSYTFDAAGDINTTGTYRMNGTDYGQYFIDSAGSNNQVWASDGSGRGGWTNMSSLINNNDYWQYNSANGIAPSNLSFDTLIGGTTTASAKIALTSTGNITATGTLTAATTGTLNGINVNAGTISSATWNGSIISTQYGGTGANLSSVAQYSIPYFSASGIMGNAVAPGTEGYVLATHGAGSAPSWVSADSIAPYQWRLTNEQLAPTNALNYDVMIGGTTTASATIALQAHTGAITANKLYIRDTDATNTLNINWNENDTANRALNLSVGGSDRYLTMNRSLTVAGTQDGTLSFSAAATLTVSGASNINQDVTTTANPTFAGVNADGINVGISTANTIDTDSGNLVLGTTTDIGSSTTGLRIDTNGSLTDIDGSAVGIGENLDVTGSVRLGAAGSYNLLNTSAAGGAPTGSLYWGNRTLVDSTNVTSYAVSSLTSGNGLVGTATQGSVTMDVDLLTVADGTGATSSYSGLEFGGAGNDKLTLLQGCADGETLKYTDSNGWACATDNNTGTTYTFTNGISQSSGTVKLGGNLTESTTLTQGSNAFTIANNGTANTTINLSSTGDFDVQDNGVTALFVRDDGNVGIGTNAPGYKLDAAGDINTTGTYRMSGTDYGQYFIDSAGSNNQVWKSDGSGRGGWGTDVGFANPMTTQGDLIYGGSSGTPTRLAGSTVDGYVLKYNTSTNTPYWAVDATGASNTYENGLTLATGVVKWGGALTGDTTITNANYSTTFNLSGTGDFNIQDNGATFASFTDSGTFTLDSLTMDGTSLTSSGNLGLLSGSSNDVVITSRGNAFTWPTSAGSSNYVMTTNGAGVLAWADPTTLAGGTNYWQLAPGGEQVSLKNALWHDLMIGGTSTSAATIAMQAHTGAVTMNQLYIRDTDASNTLHLNWNENDTSNRSLNLNLGGGDRYFTMNEDFTIGDGAAGTLTYTTASTLTVAGTSYINQDVRTTASPTFAGITAGNYQISSGTPSVLGTTTGPMNLTPAAGSNLNVNLSGTGDLAVNNDDFYVDTSTGFVGIGTATPTAQLDVGGTNSVITNSSGDITIDAASNQVSFNSDNLTNISNIAAGGNVTIDGQLRVGRFASNPTAIGSGTIVFNTTSNNLQCYNGTAWVECSGDIVWALVDNQVISKSASYDVAIGGTTFDNSKIKLFANGDAMLTGQLLLGSYTSGPTPLGAGSLAYDSTSNAVMYFDGTSWLHLATDTFKSTSGTVANGSYLELVHNNGTNNLITTAWIQVGNVWKKIENFTNSIIQNLQNQFDDSTSKIRVSTVGGYSGSAIQLNQAANLGNGADGTVTISADTNINTTSRISGRSCADGGDAVNYSVTALTSTTATLSTTPSTGCIAAGDEILLINLQGTTSYMGNVGNYETLRVASVSSNVITFTTVKTKYYGNTTNVDDSNIGTATTNQRVMLQRVPNYTNLTVNSGVNFYPSAWNGTKGGVLFFRANGTVTVTGVIHAAAYGYYGGDSSSGVTNDGGEGGEAYCGPGGLGGSGSGATGGGGDNGATGGTGYCGGGGGGAGTGSASSGGGGGGGAGYYGAGGGGGYGTAATGGGSAGVSGGTNSSGNGGTANYTGGGGGGGTYGDTGLTKLFMGSGGGAGGNGTSSVSGYGGRGGGIVAISAGTITVTGSISTSGAGGTTGSTDRGGGGGGAGGSILLTGQTVNLGSGITVAAGGAGAAGSAYTGGNGGSGRIAVYYANSVTGTSSPGSTSTQVGYFPYGVFQSTAINTGNVTQYNPLKWENAVTPNTKISLQTRSGNTTDPNDGTWEEWKTLSSQNNWVKYDTASPSASNTTSTNGRLPLGTSGRGDSARVDRKSIILDNGTYKMWYGGQDGTTWRIYYATSPDGLTWTKYDNTVPTASDTTSTNGRIPLGTAGKADSAGAVHPTVIKDGSTYKMWYAGSDGTNWRILYATSPDGLTWTKYDNTVPTASDTTSTNGRIPLGTAGKGDVNHVYAANVMLDGTTYKMWYSGSDGTNFRIFYATSSNGLTWTKYNNDIPSASDSSGTAGRIPLGTSGKADVYHAVNPTVIKDDSIYRMWYTGSNTANNSILYATSSDGIAWTKYDNNVPKLSNQGSTNGRLGRGTAYANDNWGVDHPYVLKDGSTYKMWYVGSDGSNNRGFYATTTNLDTATAPTNITNLTLESAGIHTTWTGTNATVAEGDVTRSVAGFEDENENNMTNITKISSSTNGGYAEATIAAADLSSYDYITFWVRSSIAGNVLQIGTGESAATEQTEYITIDNADTWQKVYWDLSDIAGTGRNAITKLRLTNLTTSSNTIYIDNVQAEKASSHNYVINPNNCTGWNNCSATTATNPYGLSDTVQSVSWAGTTSWAPYRTDIALPAGYTGSLTYSAWVKAASGTLTGLHAFFYDDGVHTTHPTAYTATNGWVKYTWTFDNIAIANQATSNYAGLGMTLNGTAYIWGNRWELGSSATQDHAESMAVASTPNKYLQYRAILTTTNSANLPQLENVSLAYGSGFSIEQVDTNTVRLYNYSGAAATVRLDVASQAGGSGGGTYTFNNGLTEANGTASLGGSLTKDTSINLGNNNLSIDLDGTGDFAVTANSNPAIQVNDDGNVGIGTTTPATKFQVAGTSTVQNILPATDATYDLGATTSARFKDAYLSGALYAGGSLVMSDGNIYQDNGSLNFSLMGVNGGKFSAMTLSNAGNLGVGTTSPTSKLHLYAGTGSLKETLQAADTGAISNYLSFNTGLYNATSSFSRSNAAWQFGVIQAGTTSNSTDRFYFGREGISTNDLVISRDGYVGIGLSNPSEKLDVNGSIHIAASTPNSTSMTLYNNSGSLYWNGVALSTGSSVSGTTGYLPKFTGSASLGNSMVYEDTNGIGIGTTNITHKLTIGGSSSRISNSSGDLTLDSYSNKFDFSGDSLTHISYLEATGSAGLAVVNIASSSGTTLFNIAANGNVGIGTTSPIAQTEIYGTGQLTAAITDAGARTGTLSLNGSSGNGGAGGALLFGNSQSHVANSVGFAAIKGLLVDGSGNTAGDLAFSTRNATADTALTERLRITYNGNVGIGTNNPGAKLEISSNAYQFFMHNTDFVNGSAGSGMYMATIANSGNTGTLIQAAMTGNTAGAILSLNGYGGNVGIGTTTPVSTLSVSGSTRFAGSTLNVSGFNSIGDQESMVPNSGFEVNDDSDSTVPDGWTTGGSEAHNVTTDSLQGAQAVTLYGTSTTFAQLQSACMPITGGSTYNLYGWAKSTAASGDGLYLQLVTYTTGNCSGTISNAYSPVNNVAATTSWVKYGGTATTVSGEKSAKIYVINYLPNTSCTMTVDSVRLTPAAVTNSIDLAENYYSTESLLPGQLVRTNNDLSSGIRSTAADNDQSLMGIVSTNPAITLGEGLTGTNGSHIERVALSGRVPAIVSSVNGAIKSGDYITSSSSINGVGAKSIKAGRTIGTALETISWNTASCQNVNSFSDISWPADDGSDAQARPCYRLSNGTYVGKIMVFVNPSWYDPDVYLTNTGDVTIAGQDDSFQAVTAEGTIVTRVAQFAEAVIAKLRVGSLFAQKAEVKELSVNGKSIDTMVADEVAAQLSQYSAASSSAVPATNYELRTTNLETSTATIAGAVDYNTDEISTTSTRLTTLENSTTTKFADIDALIATMSARASHASPLPDLNDLGLTASDSALTANLTTTATSSADLILTPDMLTANMVTVNDFLSVTGESVLTNVTITNSLTLGNWNILQSDGLLSFGSLLTLNSTGNIVTINGDLAVTGKVTATDLAVTNATISGELQVSTLTVDNIYNKQLELLASQSAELKAEVASLSAALNMQNGTPSAALNPKVFAKPSTSTESASLPMPLEDYLAQNP